MRELLNLFSETESRDELGIGQIRDAFSDSLFPGTSTLHTRARYLILVPWCFRAAEQRRLSGAALVAQAERNERRLLVTLKEAGVTEGLIGRRVGPAVKTLPSTVYWGALGQYRIRLKEGSAEALATGTAAPRALDEPEELVDPAVTPWCPTLPPVPDSFPDVVERGLDLDRAEAAWLHDRLLEGCQGSLLEHLLSPGHRPDEESTAPWDDGSTRDAGPDVVEQLHHAELFSLAMHGAALLYNLLVAERYEQAGLTRLLDPVDSYREKIAEWAQEVVADSQLRSWDRQAMWDLVIERNGRVAANLGVRTFVDGWLDVVQAGDATSAASRTDLRDLVRLRERQVKKAQSRLVNDKLLRDWSGSSGGSRLTYRWRQVKRLLIDIHNGIEEPDGASA